MRDVELYRHLLGIEPPWTVTEVELKVADQRVDVRVGHADGLLWPCPDCGAKVGVYDHAEERAWRHLDSCQFKTYLHARAPRVRCPEHGVRQAKLPWAERTRVSCVGREALEMLVLLGDTTRASGR